MNKEFIRMTGNLLLIAGAITLLYSTVMYWYMNTTEKEGVLTRGAIIREEKLSQGTNYHYIVSFDFNLNQILFKTRSNYPRDTRFHIGDSVQVVYDKKNPFAGPMIKPEMIDRYTSPLWLGSVLVCLGILVRVTFFVWEKVVSTGIEPVSKV